MLSVFYNNNIVILSVLKKTQKHCISIIQQLHVMLSVLYNINIVML